MSQPDPAAVIRAVSRKFREATLPAIERTGLGRDDAVSVLVSAAIAEAVFDLGGHEVADLLRLLADQVEGYGVGEHLPASVLQ